MSKEGYLKSDAQSKTEILNDQFHSVFTKEDMEDFPNMGPSPHQAIGKITIDQRGVHKLLSNLQSHKATGPDQIPSFVLKAVADDGTFSHQIIPSITGSWDSPSRMESCQGCSYLQERGKTYMYSDQLPSSIPDLDNMQDLGTHRAQQYNDPLRQV